MVDFLKIKTRVKNGIVEIYPTFLVKKTKDLMVRGGNFYAIWDEENNSWDTNIYKVKDVVDKALYSFAEEKYANRMYEVLALGDYETNQWSIFNRYCSDLPDSFVALDTNITFQNTPIDRASYSSKRVGYNLVESSVEAYEELVSTLYDVENRDKIEWAIGAIVDGSAKSIQKFLVLYGEAGTGKSTILNIIEQLFDGYYTAFEAKALVGNNNNFATEIFKSNPLVAIQHDGDLSRIEDNTKLNSIVSHEMMQMNEKYKSAYQSKSNAFLFMGTNKPVKITDAKSGIIRRLIDVVPTGNKVPPSRYNTLMKQIRFELGGIAHFCLQKFRNMGVNYYSDYRPIDMMLKTDVFYNFIEDNFFIFKKDDGVSLVVAYEMYKNYANDANIDFKLPKYKFREELKNYFKRFDEVTRVDGKQVRNYYSQFIDSKFTTKTEVIMEESKDESAIQESNSIFDEIYKNQPAQYANEEGFPINKWDKVKTKLKDIDTSKLHYVLLPDNHVVIDFDMKVAGVKDLELNKQAASEFPKTYTELSKSGKGIHLHYFYKGDPNKLCRVYDDRDIEIKTFTGKQSLRRQLTLCNNHEMVNITNLPLKKGGKKLVNDNVLKNEKQLRIMILKNLNKEIHSSTKPSIDFIDKLLRDAKESNMKYDVSDLKSRVIYFASTSTNQKAMCMKIVANMPFTNGAEEDDLVDSKYVNDELVFFDVEVFPNLFIVVYKVKGRPCVGWINPTPDQISSLLKYKLVGFNNRRYDNHILYARVLGFSNEQLYNLSQRIISNDRNALFLEAYNLSHTDIYDFSSKKQSLKKFEIELGLFHLEMDLPWDQPVDPSLWEKVLKYCENDVIATEEVFNSRFKDYKARLILSKISGLSPNFSTQSHAERIVFGKNNKTPQSEFEYTDLSKMFPGYIFRNGKSTYRGHEASEGGFVFVKPGYYENVALLDVTSMHPTSAELLNMFGKYTQKYNELRYTRVAIKNKEVDKAKNMMGGILAPFLEDVEEYASLADALKLAINIVAGLSCATFPNAFKDPRNIDNIMQKRGALFMIDLLEALRDRGSEVIHIKTDSVKIANATPDDIEFVHNFGKRYGYNFEHEADYEKFCIVNKAEYICREKGVWSGTGTKFINPYVFKKLFTKEEITIDDMAETKSVTKGAMYLVSDSGESTFVGRVGTFLPVLERGSHLMSKNPNKDKMDTVIGTKGYLWLETPVVKKLGIKIDESYYEEKVQDLVTELSQFCDVFNQLIK